MQKPINDLIIKYRDSKELPGNNINIFFCRRRIKCHFRWVFYAIKIRKIPYGT